MHQFEALTIHLIRALRKNWERKNTPKSYMYNDGKNHKNISSVFNSVALARGGDSARSGYLGHYESSHSDSVR